MRDQEMGHALNALLLIEHGLSQSMATRVAEQWRGKCAEIASLRTQLASARTALERLACRHVTAHPVWWQREAREAISALTDENSK